MASAAHSKVNGWMPFIALLITGAVHAAALEPAALKAWDEYIESASTRMEQRLNPGKTFLWVDEDADRLARVRAGEVVVAPAGPHIPHKVPSGLIHHWVGATFIPKVSMKDVLAVLDDYAHYKDIYQPAVIDSKVVSTSNAKDRFSLVLMNKSFFLKSAMDTDYESHYVRVDDHRGYSVSRTTRVQEIEEYGSPSAHAMPEGQGRGIIWRLFGIVRYVERDGGVYMEIEAMALSRDIPASLHWLVEPIVRRVSQNSLSTSLRQTENAVRAHGEILSGKSGSAGSTGRETHSSR